MALTAVSFTTSFNFVTKKFNFTDTTNYTAQGIASNDVAICFNITDPLGNTLYNNTDFTAPDIDPAIALTCNTIDLLTDSDGNVVVGSYSITATYDVSLDTLYAAHSVTKTYSLNLDYESPVVGITLTANCITPLLKSVDITNYRYNGVDPTITRVHTIFYPAVLQLAGLTGTGSTLQTSTFYTNEHSSEVVATLSYAFTGYTVTDEVTGTATIDVVCDAELCDIYCCIAAEWNRYQTYKNTNKVKSTEHLTNWTRMMSAAGQIGIALDCGKDADVSSLTSYILDLGNCQTGCGCTDGDPVPVVGLSGLGSADVAVDTCGNGITVTQTTQGSTTVYTVCLTTAIATKINNAYNTSLVAGTNVSLSSTTDADGNIQYTVNADTQTVPNMITLLGRITYSAGNVATFTLTDAEVTGTMFQEPAAADFCVLMDNGTTASNYTLWKVKNNYFKVKNFFVSGMETDFKALVQTNKFNVSFSYVGGSTTYNYALPVFIWSTTQSNGGEVFFRFFDQNSTNVYTNETLTKVSSVIDIAIVIHE